MSHSPSLQVGAGCLLKLQLMLMAGEGELLNLFWGKREDTNCMKDKEKKVQSVDLSGLRKLLKLRKRSDLEGYEIVAESRMFGAEILGET